MSDIGRNEKCSCGSGKKFKKCCLPKHEEQSKWANDLVNKEFEEWQNQDEAVGIANMQQATHNPPAFAPTENTENKG